MHSIQCRSRYAQPTLPWATSARRQLVLIHKLEGALSLLQAEAGPSREVGSWPSTTSRATRRPAGLVASTHHARVANTHRQRGSASETVPCAAAAAPRPVHLHRTLRRARKRLLARPRAAARARALPTGPHAASAAFLKGASRAATVRRARTAARNSRHRGRTRQPAAAKPLPAHLKDDTITPDDAEDAPGTRTKTAPSAKTC